MNSILSIPVFILAALCEIGGGYLVWLWLKQDKPIWFGIAGAVILALYGVVVTLQTSNFGRVYAAYGGIFIVISLLWAWKFDNFIPDKYDIIGALVVLAGVTIIYYTPRT